AAPEQDARWLRSRLARAVPELPVVVPAPAIDPSVRRDTAAVSTAHRKVTEPESTCNGQRLGTARPGRRTVAEIGGRTCAGRLRQAGESPAVGLPLDHETARVVSRPDQSPLVTASNERRSGSRLIGRG